MPDSDNKKSRRALKNLPPDRFQPKMLIFWLALVAAVLALLYYTPGMSSQPEVLQIMEVVERAEAKNIQANPPGIIRPDLSGGRDGYTITGSSRKDEAGTFRPFRASGRVTDSYEFATSNLRIGLTDRLEVDVVWQPYGIADQRGGGPVSRGIGSVDLRWFHDW